MIPCIFCQPELLQPDIFFEDEFLYALLSKDPVSHGHSVITTKHHYTTLEDIPSKEVLHLFSTLPKIAKKILYATDTRDYNVIINAGTAAGQRIPHLHIHIIPRNKGDGIRLHKPTPSKLILKEKTSLLKRLRLAYRK
ncbi:MAG: HIT family protein [Nanoarchaeota archaeon]